MRSSFWDWSDAGLLLTPVRTDHREKNGIENENDEVLLHPCCLCYLVDAKVSHPEDNRAGHELGLGALWGRRAVGGAGGGAYPTCKGKMTI